MDRKGFAQALVLLSLLLYTSAHADFPAAVKEYNEGHFDVARAEFLALAELGDAASQFNLGAMALHGQGEPEDLGVAVGWLMASEENGSHRLTPEKLADLRAKLTDAQRQTAEDILNRYGRAGLLKTALPVPNGARCTNLVPARPHRMPAVDSSYYPRRGLLQAQNGFVIVQLTVGVDGVPRDPEILMSVPDATYSAAAVAVSLQATFEPALQGGVPVESKSAMKVAFNVSGVGVLWNVGRLKTLRESALTGDPTAQYWIGLAATLDPSLGIPGEQAYRLLVSAAQGGQPQAQYWAANRFMSLGNCDAQTKKLPWLRAAAKSGDGASELALALDLLNGGPSPEQQAEARSLLQQAAQSENFYVRKHVTALMAASPLDAIRDPARAAQLAQLLTRDAIQTDPQMFEAIAAAQAVNADFKAAAESQETAITKANGLHWNTQLMQERLEEYRKSHPWFGDVFAMPPPVKSGPMQPGAELARESPPRRASPAGSAGAGV
jgi:TonB family protein